MKGRNTTTEKAPVPKRMHKVQPFAELSVVSTRHPVDAEGRKLPAGARGTIVAAYADGTGYEVEFFEPFHAVVTLEAGDLAT